MSRWLFTFERELVRERLRRGAIAGLVIYLLLYWMDGTLFRWMYVGAGRAAAQAAREAFEGRPWAQMLKLAGYLPVWAVAAAVLALSRRGLDGLRVLGAGALGGALAEVLKPIVAQVRPLFTGGKHIYRHSGMLDGERVSFGMASSHAGVAFGAACMLVFLYGRGGWVAVALAAGCALERMMAGSHFATDVYVGAVLGYASARLVRPGGWHGAGRGLLLP